jgi:hypothetical protein
MISGLILCSNLAKMGGGHHETLRKDPAIEHWATMRETTLKHFKYEFCGKMNVPDDDSVSRGERTCLDV